MKFELKKSKDGIRNGRITTAHGVINTPFFMPVGTVGSVKGVSPDELKGMGAQIVLSNTYHLYLRPGEKLIKELGGLHQFMRWDGPILTDSGGYQVFSLGKRADNNQDTRNPSTGSGPLRGNNQTNSKLQFPNSKKPIDCHSELDSESIQTGSQIKPVMTSKSGKSLVKISEEGVEFTSHIDGSKHFFTPEKVIDIQLDLGVDILMPLDVCPSGKASKAEIEEAVRLTIEWAKRSKLHFDKAVGDRFQVTGRNLKTETCNSIPALFGIVQGGLDAELRNYCAEELIKLDFDGYSIGGLAVDHETRDMWKTVKLMGEILPEDKPRYLMGVGTPDDIIKAVGLGVDMFDCVLPTRLARHGSVYICKPKPKIEEPKAKKEEGDFDLINLLNSKYRSDGGVIEEGCDCTACSGGFSRAYISHLIRNNEILGLRLATLHNLRQYLRLMEEIRLT